VPGPPTTLSICDFQFADWLVANTEP